MQGMKNFCNHIEPVELDFTNGAITLITGPNGIGKTSILQAIPYTLYGQCEKGRGEDVLNDKTKKDCHTWCIFKIDDVKYRVDRYVKYTRIGNSVTITKGDDSKPYLKGHSEVVPEIEKLLMPYKLFMNTLLFSQKVKTFFTDLTDSEQKEIFRKIMTLDDYVLYGNTCSSELKKLQENVQNINQTIAITRGLLEKTETQLNESNEKKRLFEEEKIQKIDQLNLTKELLSKNILDHLLSQKDLPADSSIRITEIGNLSSVLSHRLSNLSSENENKVNSLNGQGELKKSQLEKNYLELLAKSLADCNKRDKTEDDNLRSELLRLQGIMDTISLEIQGINLTKEGLNSSITFIEKDNLKLNLESGISECPTCKREIDDDCINNLTKLKQENIDEIALLRNQISELQIKIGLLEIKKTSINELVDNTRIKFREAIRMSQAAYQDEICELSRRKTSASEKVDAMIAEAAIKIQNENIEDRKNINNELETLRVELETLLAQQKTITEFNERLQELQNSKNENDILVTNVSLSKFDNSFIESCILDIAKYQTEITNYIIERSKYDEQIKMVEFWKVGFSSSGIQSMLIDEAIPFMNTRISYYMGLISGGRYTVTFDTLKATKDAKEFRDKISVNVFDNMTHSDKRVKFSGGQTRLVDIGTILTLADLQANIQNTSVNIILFDEIFDSLDSENIRYAANLLRLVGKTKWVGIISHNKIDDIEADNVLEFR